MSPLPGHRSEAPEEIDVSLPDAPPAEKPWDPEPDREKLRGYLAAALICIDAGIVALGFVWMAFGWASEPALKDYLTLVLTPFLALTGSAIGFYFGGRRP